MSEEKKNEVTEEVKEEARKLSEEELERVTGGARATSCRDAVVPQIE
ncbi:MAG: hypothetical protein Q4A04_09850 [Eubacteriales bacterium]|nr:hypothetical protein [Eubacteriales bacterium]